MKLAEIIKTVKPLAVEGPLDHEISGITYDSRRVMPGNLFVAFRGERTDGHSFVEAAIDRGAAAVVLERDTGFNPRATRIKVSDARRSLAHVSAQFYNHPSQKLKVVGITGTNGKTTTAFMVRAIMEMAEMPCGLLGTVQYQIGQRVIPAARTTPESVEIQEMMSDMLRAGCVGVSMEVSSHALDQSRVAAVDFDIAVFTNLSQDHLDYHHTMKNYFESKAKLFSALGTVRKTGRAVVNADNAYGCELIKRLGGDAAVLSYGVSSAAVIRAEDVRVSAEGCYFVVHAPQGSMPMSLPLIGRYNVSNALAAVAVGLALGIDLGTIEAALAQFRAVPGRVESVNVDEEFRILIDYAHTAEALHNVLVTVGELTRGRLILVFGCGGDRDNGKRKPMGEAACELADFSILTNDNPRTEEPRSILKQIEEAFPAAARTRYQIIEDRREAIERALDIARPGDSVLIAGKGHETYQEFADTVVPFNDRQVVEEYFSLSGSRWKPCV
ncbi:MAG TPA: UDP-N-acetylmuramoyl-L-alanyl-D-glutamate--2,6-diaminopimelate ligase [Verrucomicrobiae bacterium]|nr:UDP-N-acetylmuramoyl-L-alanyl-D-glutamate--2,6-diaminopimelate ligase [Verrucomicrobiae bacterium]